MCCSVLQRVAVYCSHQTRVLRFFKLQCWGVLQLVAVCCHVLQCVAKAIYCSMWQQMQGGKILHITLFDYMHLKVDSVMPNTKHSELRHPVYTFSAPSMQTAKISYHWDCETVRRWDHENMGLCDDQSMNAIRYIGNSLYAPFVTLCVYGTIVLAYTLYREFWHPHTLYREFWHPV